MDTYTITLDLTEEESVAMVTGLVEHSVMILEALYINDSKDELSDTEKSELEELAKVLKVLIEKVVDSLEPHPDIHQIFKIQ